MRYKKIDAIRGLILISMIVYHAVWDLVYVYGCNWDWFDSLVAYIWQQSISWSFIFLSGFCWSIGSKHLRRGWIVFVCGLIISGVTLLFTPESRILCGVLTGIGSYMILMIAAEKLCKHIPWKVGVVFSFGLFLAGKILFSDYGCEPIENPVLRGVVTLLGFPERRFFSTDYFPIIPWFFLFQTGYFVYQGMKANEKMQMLEISNNRMCAFLGRHSLWIYMIHQPVLYGLFYMIFRIL